MAKKVSDLFGHGKSHRSKVVKAARKGHDFGKKNVPGKTGFDAVAAKAGGGEKGKRIAAAAFWKKVGK